MAHSEKTGEITRQTSKTFKSSNVAENNMLRLLDIQKNSFEAFRAFVETDSNGKSELLSLMEKNMGKLGIKKIYMDEDALRDPDNEHVFTEKTCFEKRKTYAVPVKAETKDGICHFLFSVPMMTDRATFIINGVERVMLTQLILSPGVSFEWARDQFGKLDLSNGGLPTFISAKFVPQADKHPWIKFQLDKEGELEFSVWGKKEQPVKTLFEVCGVKANANPSEEAVKELYEYLGFKAMASKKEMEKAIKGFFFDEDKFYLGPIGRESLKRKLGSKGKGKGGDPLSLNPSDFKKFERIVLKKDPDLSSPVYFTEQSLSEKRVRGCGDFLLSALTETLSDQFWKMNRQRQDNNRPVDDNENQLTKLEVFCQGANFITRKTKQRFTNNTLLQVVDQTNPLSELTQKRRLSCFGPGGLSSKNVKAENRFVDPSHRFRICPIETPEGSSVGVVTSLALSAKINHETSKIEAEGDQMFSVSGALIPFIEHDDAHRALMAANMQRQAIPLLYPDAPYVGTGMEHRVAAESAVIPVAAEDGTVKYVDAKKIVYEGKTGTSHTVALDTFRKTNKKTSFNLRPIVEIGEEVLEGQVLADGYSTDRGDLALGANLLAAYMCWEGYNYEDGIVISQRVLDENLLTSVHIVECSLELRELKFKEKDDKLHTFTEEIQAGTSSSYGDHIDSESGIVKVGSFVSAGDVLAVRKSYKKRKELSPSDMFLKLAGKTMLNDSDIQNLVKQKVSSPFVSTLIPLKVPDGIDGVVVETILKPADSTAGENETLIVRIAQTRKLEVGDKLAGRHGNKGVISKILPTHEMPFLADGTPVDIILNPLGVPSRMNVGQLYEAALGWAGKELGEYFACPAFASFNKSEIDKWIGKTKRYMTKRLAEGFAPVMEGGKMDLFDGRTGEPFKSKVAVGYAYMMKLNHMVQDKVHARSTGPYGQIECQPIKGRKNQGGQRLGDMEGWAIEAYGASNLLHELFTARSDLVSARKSLGKSDQDQATSTPSGQNRLPESTEALMMYLRALCLKPVYSPADHVFELSFAEAKDIKGENGDWPESKEVSSPGLLGYRTKIPQPIEGGLFDEEIFGLWQEEIGKCRDKMGYVKLNTADTKEFAVYHPWFEDRLEIECLPVLPVPLRPITHLDNGAYDISDLNILYRNVILHNDVLKEIRDEKKNLLETYGIKETKEIKDVFSDIAGNAVSSLQESVDQLIDNKNAKTSKKDESGRLYDSLVTKISGKTGIVRQNLLGKRSDYSGRSVIAPDPLLAFDECGIPIQMAKELFATKLESGKDLEGIAENALVLLNRAPTLHRMGIQAYRPVITDAKAIQLHPLACSGFNADFDGDTMAVYAIIGDEETQEARDRILASLNMLSPASGKCLASPSQDMVIGIYSKTATENGREELYQEIWSRLKWKDLSEKEKEELESSVSPLRKKGKIPPLPDEQMKKTQQSEYAKAICRAYTDAGLDISLAAPVLNRFMQLGFKYATTSGLTVSYADTIIEASLGGGKGKFCNKVDKLIKEARDKDVALEGEFALGMIESEEAWERQRRQIWEDASGGGLGSEINELVETAVKKNKDDLLLKYPILAIADSGARGDMKQIRQLIAARGLMAGSYGEPVLPLIYNCLAKGVTSDEYWTAVYGSRAKVMNTALGTAISGEFARRLVNAVQDVVVKEEDCQADSGRVIEISEDNRDSLVGRYLAKDKVVDAEGKKKSWKANTLLRAKELEEMLAAGVDEIEIRSPLSCKTEHGVCQKCYGWDLSKRADVEMGLPVGIIAAQSLSEPATQMTLSSFHGGGAAGDDITTKGLSRIEELLGADPRGKAAKLSEYNGVVTKIEQGDDECVIYIADDDEKKTREATIPEGQKKLVDVGDEVRTGQALSDGEKPKRSRCDGKVVEINLNDKGRQVVVIADENAPKIRKVKVPSKQVKVEEGEHVTIGQPLLNGTVTPQMKHKVGEPAREIELWLLEELDRQLEDNGIDIDDKHLEVIVAEMFRDADTNKELHSIRYLQKHPVSDSFLSRISTASIKDVAKEMFDNSESVTDNLEGLKENMILGRSVPVGDKCSQQSENDTEDNDE